MRKLVVPDLRWLFTTIIAGPESVSTISTSPTDPRAKRAAILRACESDNSSTGFGFLRSSPAAPERAAVSLFHGAGVHCTCDAATGSVLFGMRGSGALWPV